MNIIAVDDEKIALNALMGAIVKAAPEARVHGFRSPSAIKEYLKDSENGSVDVAFLDIEMRGENGLEAAKTLIDSFPNINIIFTTGYSEYTLDALQMHASGYIMKPVTADRVRYELEHLRFPVKKKGLYARAFGNFEVFYGDTPVNFRYQKTRELLAYLIDRKGAQCRNNEIISVLFEDDGDENSHISYLKNIRTDLVNVLSRYGKEDCLIRTRGEMGIVMDRLDCDYFDYLNNPGDEEKSAAFRGEYMSQYSWGEYTLGNLLKERGYV